MRHSFEEQIHELVENGRISNDIAEELIEHYSGQQEPLRKGAVGSSSRVDLMALMNLIDLLEKKKDLPKTPTPLPEPPPQKVRSIGSPSQLLHENKEDYLISPQGDNVDFERKRWEARNEELKKKCDKLEAELVAGKRAYIESLKMEAVYAKRCVELEEERQLARPGEEKTTKALEEENARLVRELKRMCESEERAGKRAAELEAAVRTAQARLKSLEDERLLH